MVVIVAATSARWKRVRTVGLLSLALTALAACDAATEPAVPMAAQDQRTALKPRVAPDQRLEQEQRVARGGGPCGVLYGFIFRPEPLTVYERPDAGSPVLGRVLGADEVRPEVRILDARDGWLRIVDAHDDQGNVEAAKGEGAKAREMYSGVGWVRGEGVTVILQTSFAFAAPRHDAAVVLEAGEGGWLNEIGEQVAVIGCEEGWILARWDVSPHEPENPYDFRRRAPQRYADFAVVSRDPLIVEGWSTGVCDIQETTCDGVDGDVPQNR